MKALLLTEYSKLIVTDLPQPDFGADDLLVRVKSCGICGSDVHGYDGGSGRRIPPLVMGHEAAGVVADVGSEVTQFAVGDRVTFDSTVSCGRCGYCQRGRINLCDNRMVLGVSCGEYRRYGAFAEYVAVPQRIAYKLPDTLSFDAAAMIEAVSVAVHAVHRSTAKEGDSAVVVGAGMIGLLILQVLRHVGCTPIFAVDLDETRLALARRFGADETFDASAQDAATEILQRTAGVGVAAALEAVGATPTVAAAIASVRKGGGVTLVGNISAKIDLPLQLVVTRELSLYGTCASQGEYPECIDLMAQGIVDVGPLITATGPLDEGPAWFERLHSREPGLMKVVLNP
ncbi:MAG: galactitol-1-phosphate 5-dehydrogenase [Planctomycetota bacterium]